MRGYARTQVSFTHELDVYEFCSPELKQTLDGPRAAYKAHQDRLIQRKKDEDKAVKQKNNNEVRSCVWVC